MSTEQILSLLIAERDRLGRAIEALQGGVKRRGRPPGTATIAASTASASAAPAKRRRKRKPLSPEQKKAQSERMKAFWAARRKKAGKK
jgi:hypothetical protein